MQTHFIPNFDFDKVFLDEIGLWGDIRRCLSNLAWVEFHEVGVGFNLDIMIECTSTMRLDRGGDISKVSNF